MELMLVLLISVVIFCVQMKLCRADLGFWKKMIPAVVLAAAAVVVCIIYCVEYWGYGSAENTMALFLVTMALIYLGVTDGLAWLVDYVIKRAEERKYNS